MRRFAALSAALFLVSATAAAVAGNAGATTPSGVAIDMPTFRHVLADGQGHVFLTGGPGTTSVLVRHSDGSADATIPAEGGATGMALSPDGNTLYVALSDNNAIAAISTSTLAETARYATGGGTCPSAVLPLGTKIWFGYSCGSGGGIGVVDLAAPTPTVTTGVITAVAPDLLAGSGSRLFAGVRGGSAVTGYDISGATLTLAHSTPVGDGPQNLADLTLSSDGSHVLVASGGEYDIASYGSADLTRAGRYGSNYPYPVAVAAAPTGPVVAGIDASYDKDVRVYDAAADPLQSFEIGDNDSNTVLSRDGLALSPDGSHLYAVTQAIAGGSYRLHVLTNALGAPTALSLTAPKSVGRAAATALSMHLTSGGAAVPGVQVSIVRHDASGDQQIGTPSTDGTGTATVTDHPPVGGAVTYTATWAGNTAYGPATSTAATAVSRAPSSLVVSATGGHAYGSLYTVHAHLGPTYNGRTVTLSAAPLGGARHVMRTAQVDSQGNLTATYRVVRRTTFTASFPGDYRYAAASRSTSVIVAANLQTAPAKSQGRSGRYALYSHKTGFKLLAQVGPGKTGECLRFVLQQKTASGWRDAAAGCFPVNSSGVVAGVAKGSPKTPFRNRVEFRGDKANSAIVSQWYYIEFV